MALCSIQNPDKWPCVLYRTLINGLVFYTETWKMASCQRWLWKVTNGRGPLRTPTFAVSLKVQWSTNHGLLHDMWIPCRANICLPLYSRYVLASQRWQRQIYYRRCQPAWNMHLTARGPLSGPMRVLKKLKHQCLFWQYIWLIYCISHFGFQKPVPEIDFFCPSKKKEKAFTSILWCNPFSFQPFLTLFFCICFYKDKGLQNAVQSYSSVLHRMTIPYSNIYPKSRRYILHHE